MTYFIGKIIGKYGITGILWLLWSFIIITVLAALLVTFKFREDTVHFQSIIDSAIGLLQGMRKIWFRVNPGVFVGPLTLTFTLYVITYGSFLILVLYLRFGLFFDWLKLAQFQPSMDLSQSLVKFGTNK